MAYSLTKPAPAGATRIRANSVTTRKAGWSTRFTGTEEPALADILDDPIMHSLMASDRTSRDHVMQMMRDMRSRLAQ